MSRSRSNTDAGDCLIPRAPTPVAGFCVPCRQESERQAAARAEAAQEHQAQLAAQAEALAEAAASMVGEAAALEGRLAAADAGRRRREALQAADESAAEGARDLER